MTVVSGQDLKLLYEYRRRKKQTAQWSEAQLSQARDSLASYFELARELKPLPHQIYVMDAVQEFLEHCWHTRKDSVKGRRILNVNLPPGAGKSSIITATTPPWILGNRPDERIGIVSAKGNLADLFELVAKGDIESSELYRAIFPDEAARPDYSRAWAQGKLFVKGLPNGEISPSLSAMSLMGSIMGKRFSLIIIDDGQDQEGARTPAMRQKTWSFIDNTVLSRAPMWCPIINVQQRLNKDDYTGRFEHHYDAQTIKVPALDDKGQSYWQLEYPAAALEQKRRADPYSFALWYQQDATHDGDGVAIFDGDTFRYHTHVVPDGWRIQSWDTAGKAGQHNDLSAYVDAVITNEGDVYIVDMGWERLDPVDLENHIEQQYARDDIDAVIKSVPDKRYPLPFSSLVMIEDASSGQTLAQRIAKLTGLPIQAVKPIKDKETRAKSVQGWFKAGKVFFPANHPKLVEFESFLLNFPQDNNTSSAENVADDNPLNDSTRHDDPVDALVQLLQAVINDDLKRPQEGFRLEWT
ncbi:MAG: phage terminase large subunit [Deinococcota bacterium]